MVNIRGDLKYCFSVQARKYLPFGFGPGKTVILEAGEIDDDEEDYGDYQVSRGLEVISISNILFQLLRQTASESPHEHWLGDNKTELQEYRKLPNDMPLQCNINIISARLLCIFLYLTLYCLCM